MSRPAFREKSFLDHLSSPLTLLPVAAGLSLLLLAWALPRERALLFAGVVSLLLGLGLLVTQWALSSGDPRLARMRQEFAEALEAACGLDPPDREAKLTTSPAPAEGPRPGGPAGGADEGK